jgi:hypothetical protein
MFGGPNGLQAIAYIALTFFAHYFPEHARKAGAQPIKDFATTHVSNEFVWWESHTILDTLPPNKYPFGHTIALTTSAAGDAVAFISLFGSLNFGVALGSIDDMTDHSVIVFIDPQADHPPDDIDVVRKTFVDDALLNQGDHPIAPRSLVSAVQAQIIGHDCTIRPATDIRGGGQVDVAENGRHDHAEDPDRDQRHPEGR